MSNGQPRATRSDKKIKQQPSKRLSEDNFEVMYNRRFERASPFTKPNELWTLMETEMLEDLDEPLPSTF